MWSANYWNILDIEATTDISKIKAAYAKKAKSVHPEEYPEEFQELQKAYKSAVKYAKLQNTYKNAVQDNKITSEKKDLKDISEKKDLKDKIEEKELKDKTEEKEWNRDVIVKPEKEIDKNRTVNLENIRENKKILNTNAIFEQESKIEDEQEFVYDEISYEEKSQQCMLDMICLAKNIYLINDIRCWEWFFSHDEYKDVYKNDEFRLNFVETIRRISGWTRKTLLYIEQFLKQYQKDSSKSTETSTLKWKILKRPKLLGHLKSKQNNVTNEQKKIHDIILASVKNRGYSGDMKDSNSFLEYISIYLEYAHNNMGRVEDLYQSGKNSNYVLTYIYVFAIFVAIIVLYGLFSGNTNQKTEQEKRVERWEQERRENIEKLNREQLQKLLKERQERLDKLEKKNEEMINDKTEEIDNDISN